MKLDTRCSHSMKHSHWVLFALLWLACSSCISIGDIAVECVPAELGANAEPSLVIWSLNAQGTQFNSLATSAQTGMRPDDTTRTFVWPSDLSQSLPPKIGSVSVLLDPSPSAELRRHVHELLMEIERTNPDVITSVTVCADRVGEITNGQQFSKEVMRLHDATADQRMNLGIAPVLRFEWLSSQWTAPRRIVIPNAASSGEYFVVSGPS